MADCRSVDDSDYSNRRSGRHHYLDAAVVIDYYQDTAEQNWCTISRAVRVSLWRAADRGHVEHRSFPAVGCGPFTLFICSVVASK